MAFDFPFYFLRHGQTDWNRTGRTQGQLDSQLDETGRQQAAQAARILQSVPIERIVASPLTRVRDTAAAVASFHDVPISYDPDLMECHLGDHQGHAHGPWLAQYWTGEYDPPNGEPFSAFCERVWGAMARAAALGPNTLIVAHGGLWKAAHEFVRIEPPIVPMPNALPVHVKPSPEGWTVEVLS